MSCQFANAAIAAWVDGEGPRGGSGATENGEAAGCWGAAENGEAAIGVETGAASNGAGAYALAGASKPKPSDGSATWNGESVFRRSGNFTARVASEDCESLTSSITVNGDSWRATAVKGLVATGAAGSGTTANGESWRVAG